MARASNRSRTPEKTPAPAYLLCAQPTPTPVVLPPNLSAVRESAIRIGAKKWVNGTVLHYCFLERAISPKWSWPEDQKNVVRQAFNTWKQLGIGLSFVEVNDESEAELRIGCLQDGRSWSFVGTDVLDNFDLGRTMNYGWDLTTTWGKATALHEIGHAIGLSHEHQNPKAGIAWDEDKVYASFSGPPNNWDRPKIFSNILKKLDEAEVEGSEWDPLSIMEYPFKPGLIISPKPYDVKGVGENVKLSDADIAWVRRWYPSNADPIPIGVMQFERLGIAAGQQRDYSFQPGATRDYKVSTIGESDCRVVIFETREGEPRHLLTEDDSGMEANVNIKAKLVKGRTYVIRVRVNYVASPDGVGLLVA
jgi:hypothetical protein